MKRGVSVGESHERCLISLDSEQIRVNDIPRECKVRRLSHWEGAAIAGSAI